MINPASGRGKLRSVASTLQVQCPVKSRGLIEHRTCQCQNASWLFGCAAKLHEKNKITCQKSTKMGPCLKNSSKLSDNDFNKKVQVSLRGGGKEGKTVL